MRKNLLPLGTVVLLKGANKRVMICGRIQTRVGVRKVYDYSAFPYPEGIVDPSRMLFFDHDSIARVYFIGFQDEEEFAFRSRVLSNLGELEVDERGEIRRAQAPEQPQPTRPPEQAQQYEQPQQPELPPRSEQFAQPSEPREMPDVQIQAQQ